MTPAITLTVPPRIERQFKAAAKAAWKRETYALVLGTVAGDHVQADELFIPEDVAQYSTEHKVTIRPEWLIEAEEAAREDGLTVVGDIHSHGWSYAETGGTIQDRVQSEGDIDCPIKFLVSGICNVQETKSKRLRASIRWHGPSVALRVERGD